MLADPAIEIFPKGLSEIVTKLITPHQPERVKCQDRSWRAKLYELNCQAALLLNPPIIAIGRESVNFFVISLHCLLQEQKTNDFGLIDFSDHHAKTGSKELLTCRRDQRACNPSRMRV